MQRFFVDPARPDRIEGGEHLHLARSLRLRAGERVELLDGERVLSAEILQVGKEHTDVRVLCEMPDREAGLRVALYIGVLKGEKMDWVVQKCAELGVDAILPIAMGRSVAQNLRVDRLRRIAREAQKQCGRARAPHIGEVADFSAMLPDFAAHGRKYVAYEGGGEPFAAVGGARDAAILIGPEGGIDEGELAALREAGALMLTMGPRVLRAETAAVASVAALMAMAGEWA